MCTLFGLKVKYKPVEANEFNLEDISRQVGDRTMQMAGEGVKNALKEKAKIVDKRYNFF